MRILLIASIIAQVALGEVPNRLPACALSLDACQGVVKAQDASIANLKKNVASLEDKLASSTRPPLLPTWAIVIGSALLGVVVGGVLIKRLH